VTKLRAKYIEPETLKKIEKHFNDDEYLPFKIALETGLRIGDICALRWRDIDCDKIKVKAQKTGKIGEWRISMHLAKILALRKKMLGGRYVFPSPRDPRKHISRQALWLRLKTKAKQIGIEIDGLSPHSLRKVYAVELYRKKGFEAVKLSLQHDYANTTEIYAFSDFTTGENANKSLQRKDLDIIARMVIDELVSKYELKERTKKGG
jgi:integrase